MPGPGAPEDGPNATVSRELQFFESTTRNETIEKPDLGAPFFTDVLTTLVARAESDSNGFFEVELEPGIYREVDPIPWTLFLET